MKKETLRILLVEDDEDDYVLARSLLAEADDVRFVLEWADTYEKATACLSPGAYEAYLVDYRLGARDGLHLLQEARGRGVTAPIIILTGQGDRALGLRAIKAGADDYLVKAEINADLLTRTIRYAVERKQAAEALQQSEALRRLAVEGAELGTWSYDLQNEELFWDERAREIFGVGAEEPLTFEKAIDIIHPDDREQTLQALQDAKNPDSSGSYEIEKRILWSDGSVRWVATKGQVRFSGTGSERKPLQLAGVVIDVTERKRAEKAIRQQSERAAALARVAARLNAQLDLDGVLDAVCEETARALGVAVVSVILYDEREELFHYAASRGLPADFDRHARPVPSAYYEALVQEKGSLITIPDVEARDDLANTELFAALDVRTLVVATLSRNGDFVGGLIMKTVGETRHFTEDEMALLQGIADQAAQAISNARLYSSAQRRLQRLRALNAIDRAILARLSMKDVLDVVLEQVLTHLDLDAAGVLLLEAAGETLEQVAGRGFRNSNSGRDRLRLGEGYAGRAAQERRLIRVADLAAVDDFVRPSLLAGEDFVSYCAVPLVAGDEVQGVLDVYHREPFDPDPEWRDFLEAVAAQAAIAVDNARLFTETRRLLRQTRRQARQVQQIIDTMPEGVILLNVGHRLIRANPVAHEFLPVLAQFAENGVITGLGDRPLADLLREAPPRTLWEEVTIPRSERIFEVGARAIGSDTHVGGWVLVVRDVTEERRRQEHIQTQERLATVGQLAAGIAHDFNNIMAVITLYSQALERDPDFPKRNQYLGTIREQAQHASNLIGQILDFSRSSALERAPLDLVPFIKETAKLLKRTLPETIRVELVAKDEACRVEGDPTHLQQALMNLAVNARDAMPQGGKLTISLEQMQLDPEQRPPVPEMAPGPWVRLAVADTGTGIAAEALAHIFEPFYTTKKRGKGTGLGLAQVYGIVKQHEGEISVESQEGAGSTFSIYLPLLTGNVSEGSGDNEQLLPPAAGEETVLVVEDEDEMRIAIQEILLDLGYQVLVAGTGREALALFEEHGAAIDVVLSDMVMPEMGGEELEQALHERWPQAKMVLMSGYPLGENGREIVEDGEMVWIRKPFTAGRLAQTMRQALDERVIAA